MNPLSMLFNSQRHIRRIIFSTLAIAILAISGNAIAQIYGTDNLVIEKVYTFATPPGAQSAGGYLTITNKGTEDDTLTGGISPFAEVTQVHEMKMVDDVMKMRHLESGMVIPAGATIELMPGGLHIMFMQLTQTLKDGDSVDASLTFSKAGELPVSFTVIDRRKQSNTQGMKHHQKPMNTESDDTSGSDKNHDEMKHDSNNHSSGHSNSHSNTTKSE